ncbi:hypothetical protein E2C01_078013 [Portunus trituberculatus]|uniref:Uncharacterized protein n=1 Tax=Portunus trituberculatus TaxID=210409 RepID=A0A5B7INS9_PORTR|nr:hypothetical protein [Portunus trituberculatus]
MKEALCLYRNKSAECIGHGLLITASGLVFRVPSREMQIAAHTPKKWKGSQITKLSTPLMGGGKDHEEEKEEEENNKEEKEESYRKE